MKWIGLCLCFLIVAGCASVDTIGFINFPDSQVRYVAAEYGNPLTGTLRVIDRYQIRDGKTTYLYTDSRDTAGFLLNKIGELKPTAPVIPSF